MNLLERSITGLKALRELGPRQTGLYACYKVGLRTGWLKHLTPANAPPLASIESINHVFDFPGQAELAAVLNEAGAARLLAEANEIVQGKVRLFGGPPVPLALEPPQQLAHWTEYDLGIQPLGNGGDVKTIWEPARFGWAYPLARAYRLTGNERYPAAFWAATERFLGANPPNLGPNWASAQEVALRLMALAFAGEALSASPLTTQERKQQLGEAIAAHAARIPPSLAYARAQNNNHLLSEAAGLVTAGLLLPAHPSAVRWEKLGWEWFNRGVLSQIGPDGAYVQNSANYHRLMLHLALWAYALAQGQGLVLPEASLSRLSAATRWLLALLDPTTGRVPNLGPNDGACILPLAACAFHDFRPVLQAASVAFLGRPAFPPGPWDELALWLGIESVPEADSGEHALPLPAEPPHVLRAPHTWGYLRLARFNDRPGHADQLHLDLWWRGLNVALDPGTYLYNAPPPWDNSLASAGVHNTLTVDGRDQMTRRGRFLYLDWAQARLCNYECASDGSSERLEAQHDGYRRRGVLHHRSVSLDENGNWRVGDRLLPLRSIPAAEHTSHAARLHWLLPDWPWELEEAGAVLILRLQSPYGPVRVQVSAGEAATFDCCQLARAGVLLRGSGEVLPTAGWFSPTYGYKEPALSLSVELAGQLPLHMLTEWQFPPSGESAA